MELNGGGIRDHVTRNYIDGADLSSAAAVFA